MTNAVANRYVTALADVVTDSRSGVTPEAALRQLRDFGGALDVSQELAAVLTSPAIALEDKRDLISEIGARIGLSQLLVNFLHVVVDHRRIGHFTLIADGFSAWLDAHRNRVEVEVRFALPMDETQKAALEERFRKITGKQVRARYVEDPDLLGGSSVTVGSTLYDGSLRASLASLAGQLATGAR